METSSLVSDMLNYLEKNKALFENTKDASSNPNYVKSFLQVCNNQRYNDNCKGFIELLCERNEDGLWDPLDIACDYETKMNIWCLRVCLIDFKKVYMYDLDYNIQRLSDPQWAEFAFYFDLNAVMDSLDPYKTHDKITVYVFTCDCRFYNCIKNCIWNPNNCALEFGRFTTIRPANEIDIPF